MKKIALTLLAAAVTCAACQEIEQPYTPEDQNDGPVLSATIEQEADTKTEMSGNKVLWQANDQIAAFLKSDSKSQYEVQSSFVGKPYADFSSISGGNTGTGEHVVAYYPYSGAGTLTLTNENFLYHILDITLPSEQTHAAGSFGNGAFPMVAVSTDYDLEFKNVCGGIKLQLKGIMKIASITISGKNTEKLAGSAKVQVFKDGSGCQFQGSTGNLTSVTLNCGAGVQLNENTATDFIIALPPVTFSKGFNISIKDTDGNTYSLSTDRSNTVNRSSILVMPAKTLENPSIESNLSGWTNVSANYGTLPEHIKVYKSPSYLQGSYTNAYIAVTDLRKGGRWDVWSVEVDRSANNGADGWLTYKTNYSFCTPGTIYNSDYWQKPPVIVNGGFFYYGDDGYNYSASLAIRNGDTQSPLSYNINYEYSSSGTLCYPTRGAFLEKADGTFDACWTYVNYTWYEHFVYPDPAPANSTTQPTLSFPANGNYFAAKTGIGGGPVLIADGVIRNTWSAEMLSGISPTSAQPRTAVGVTANREVVLFVCQGRGTTYAGLTTAQVANILKDLGCVEALNLDGGGSTCMLVNGNPVFTPSDGSQRAVANTVMIY